VLDGGEPVAVMVPALVMVPVLAMVPALVLLLGVALWLLLWAGVEVGPEPPTLPAPVGCD
jgi:hypothetical protein